MPAANLVSGLMATTSTKFSRLPMITDGDKNTANWSDSYPGEGLRWIQFDVGESKNISNIKLWHYFRDTRAYHDVIVQLSNTQDFTSGVTTVYNNDTDNCAGQGTGTDTEYG